jgi:hypothetical protein
MVHATETADAPRSQSRFRLGFGLGCLAGLVGWGLLALGFLILLLRPISSAFIPEDEPDKLADEPVISDDSEAAAVLRQIGAEVQVTIDEENFNRFLATKGSELGVPPGIGRLYMKLEDGLMEARAEAGLPIIGGVQIRVAMRPDVEDGEFVLHVEDVQAGGFRLPGFALGMVEDVVRRTMKDATSGAGFLIEEITVQEGEITIRGELKSVADEGGEGLKT